MGPKKRRRGTEPHPATARRVGKQPPRYRFFLNPYTDARFTSCPQCEGKTLLRKLPLAIHIEPHNLMTLNKTARYCPRCDLLIVHKDEVEHFLAAYFGHHAPEVVGNDYLIMGTVDRAMWKRGTKEQLPPMELFEHLHDFVDYVRFEVRGGWMPTTPAPRQNPRQRRQRERSR